MNLDSFGSYRDEEIEDENDAYERVSARKPVQRRKPRSVANQRDLAARAA